jgi:hypothetical protein
MPSMFDRGVLGAALLGVSMLMSVAQAAPTSVSYTLQGSGSQWQYDLSFSGSASAGSTLELEFADNLYANVNVVSYGPEFDFANALPSVTPGSPAVVDAVFAQDLSPPAEAHLLVSFNWLGSGGQPGSQNWILTDASTGASSGGTTTAAATGVVPEPGGVLMALSGLALLAQALRSKRRL